MKNVRFWVFWNGAWSKIKVGPEKAVVMRKFERHEEGWSSEMNAYEIDGDGVQLTTVSDGRDCDGRLRQSWAGRCINENLHCRKKPDQWIGPEWPDDGVPEWEPVESENYDEYAQEMNY